MTDAPPILVVEDNDEDFVEAMVRHFKAFWLESVLPPPEQPREGQRR